MWRPDDWEERKPRITTGAYNNGVEAGADAMHKADIEWILMHVIGTGEAFSKKDWDEFTS